MTTRNRRELQKTGWASSLNRHIPLLAGQTAQWQADSFTVHRLAFKSFALRHPAHVKMALVVYAGEMSRQAQFCHWAAARFLPYSS
jgi:hypothetical protein